MITQIIINEDKDLHISNNYGDVEPFNSAVNYPRAKDSGDSSHEYS